MGILSPKVATKTMVPLCKQMSTAYHAGIPIVRTLAILREQTRDHKTRAVLERMEDNVRQGATLGEAANAESKYLPQFFIELLSAGETGGRLDVMLKDLGDYYEDRLKMRRTIVQAATYPIIQLLAAWYLGTFALGIIGVTDLGEYVQSYISFQISAHVTALIVVAALILINRTGVIGRAWGFIAARFWPLTYVTRRTALARFFRSFGLLLGSGMHVRACLERAAAICGNSSIRASLLRGDAIIAQGGTITQALAGCPYLNPMAREMLNVGEESGDLDEALLKLSEYYTEESEHALKIAGKVGGVLIVLAVAVLIGAIIISFYSRLYGGMLNELGV